jgi:chromosome segregation ATPase
MKTAHIGSIVLIPTMFFMNCLAGERIKHPGKSYKFKSGLTEPKLALVWMENDKEISWDKFVEKVEEYNEEINEYRVELINWESENKKLSQGIRNYDSEVSAYNSMLREFEEFSKASWEEIERYNRNFKEVEAKINSLRSEFSDLDMEYSEHQENSLNNEQINFGFELAETQYKTDLSNYKSKLAEYHSLYKSYSSEVDQFDKSSRELRTPDWQNRIEQWGSSLEKMKTQLDARKITLNETNEELQRHLSKINLGNKEIADEGIRLEGLSNGLNNRWSISEREVMEVENEKTRMDNKIDRLLFRKGNLSKQKSDLQRWKIEIISKWESLAKREKIFDRRRSKMVLFKDKLEGLYEVLIQKSIESKDYPYELPSDFRLGNPRHLRDSMSTVRDNDQRK